MKSNLFWIIFLGLNQFSNNLILNEHKKEIFPLTDCLMNIIKMLGRRKVAFCSSVKSEDILSEVLKQTKIPYVVNGMEIVTTCGMEKRTPDDLVLALDESDPESIINTTLWNAGTRFVMVAKNLEKLRYYFETFWRFQLINAFALIPKRNDVVLYSFLPYGPDDCKIEGPIEVDIWSNGGFRKRGFALKDPMRLKNMNGCPISITVNDARPNLIFDGKGEKNLASSVGGFEGNLMKLISDTLNYTPTFKLPSDGMTWGWIRPSPHGTVGEVYLGVSEMAVGILGALLDRYETLDLSRAYNMQECVTFGVPLGMGAKNSAWLTIFVFDFTFFTWVLIIFSFVLININIWVINRYSDVNWFGSKTELVIAVFSSCLGAPIKIPNFESAKTSVAFWFIFSFIITVAYKASMGSKLAVPPRDADIFTFPELINSKLELVGLETMIQLMIPKENWIYKKMRKRYLFSNQTASYFVNKIANNEMIAHLRHRTTFIYYSLLNPKARGRVHLLTDCLILYFPILILRKHSPMTNKVNYIIARLDEGGIMSMWRSKYIYKVPPIQKPFHKLSRDQMYGVYLLLILGNVIAFFAFLWEIFYSKNRKTKKIKWRLWAAKGLN